MPQQQHYATLEDFTGHTLLNASVKQQTMMLRVKKVSD
jgi:hypothetical protein